ncbi:MAG: hypothetical protein OXU61_11345 [Gammaproteobacteria bacterium]|nr:hypothetical protein [Gammaproteobacteria bacterium]
MAAEASGNFAYRLRAVRAPPAVPAPGGAHVHHSISPSILAGILAASRRHML